MDIEASPRNSDCNCLPRASCSVRCFSARATILIPSLGFLLAEARFRFDFFKRNSPSWKVNVLVDLGLRANRPKLPLQCHRTWRSIRRARSIPRVRAQKPSFVSSMGGPRQKCAICLDDRRCQRAGRIFEAINGIAAPILGPFLAGWLSYIRSWQGRVDLQDDGC